MTSLKEKIKGFALLIFHLNDTPHGIALGVSLGMFLSILPTFGIGMIVALALAPFLRANPVSTYLGTLVVNPLNGTLVYSFNYWIGSLLLGSESLFFMPDSFGDLKILGGRLYLGGIIVSCIVSSAAYFILLGLLQWQRKNR